ncbi:hypothetical protein F2P81_019217 [Scophthalmus maximus]|uniref:Uncharacterized protein n=1 Tax=Scophthalmus maximus TaxID=52904 RepID=A0A6A4S950_SCOMX|nr:hypothetical protein F2P81_019217 [Scophthalmus maximus]
MVFSAADSARRASYCNVYEPPLGDRTREWDGSPSPCVERAVKPRLSSWWSLTVRPPHTCVFDGDTKQANDAGDISPLVTENAVWSKIESLCAYKMRSS